MIPGFRFAPPWALCFRLLRRLSARLLLRGSVLASCSAGSLYDPI